MYPKKKSVVFDDGVGRYDCPVFTCLLAQAEPTIRDFIYAAATYLTIFAVALDKASLVKLFCGTLFLRISNASSCPLMGCIEFPPEVVKLVF